MSEKTKAQGSELFEQAMKNYKQALQAGLKLQQESAKWWMEVMTQAGSPQDWQTKAKEMAEESVSIVQKRMEENLKLIDQSSRTSLDLLTKAMEAVQADTVSAGQTKMQEMWEASLQAMRQNAQSVTEFNSKFMESWMQSVSKAAGGADKKTPQG